MCVCGWDGAAKRRKYFWDLLGKSCAIVGASAPDSGSHVSHVCLVVRICCLLFLKDFQKGNQTNWAFRTDPCASPAITDPRFQSWLNFIMSSYKSHQKPPHPPHTAQVLRSPPMNRNAHGVPLSPGGSASCFEALAQQFPSGRFTQVHRATGGDIDLLPRCEGAQAAHGRSRCSAQLRGHRNAPGVGWKAGKLLRK